MSRYRSSTNYADVSAFVPSHAARRLAPPAIMLNKSAIFDGRVSLYQIRAILLHEIGHLKTNYKNTNSVSELRAQLWAMDFATKAAMEKELRELLKDLDFWQKATKSSQKIYKRAVLIGKKTGLL